MRNILLNITLALVLILGASSCEEEWKDELFIKEVSFAENDLQDIYIPVDTSAYTYKVPVVISGTTENDQDIDLWVSLGEDTMDILNFERFRYRDDLYYKTLPEDHYKAQSWKVTIPKGEDVGYVNMDIDARDLDLVDDYILPLVIDSTSKFVPSERQQYKWSLMRIVPYNDFSGNWSASAGSVYEYGVAESDQVAITGSNREFRVVDDSTVFFYAGYIDQELKERSKYKIRAKFTPTTPDGGIGTVELSADSTAINFVQNSGDYTRETVMDESLPYLERTRTTVYMEYEYDDLTNPDFPIRYYFTGSMTLERVRNTQIPDDMQQYEFD